MLRMLHRPDVVLPDGMRKVKTDPSMLAFMRKFNGAEFKSMSIGNFQDQQN